MNRTDVCDKQYQELFGGKRGVHPTDPEFMDILQKFIFGEVSQVGELDNKMRELITISILTALQTLPQLSAHVQAALNVGLTPTQIREALYNCAPFIGFPKTLNAIAAMNEVFVKNGIALPLKDEATVTEDNRFDIGHSIQSPFYGNEIKEKYKDIPNGMGSKLTDFLTELCFGDFYSRTGLSIQTRELLAVCVLTALGQTGPLKAHREGNLKAGNTIETIYAALLQCVPYVGFPLVFAAMDAIKD